MSFNGDVLKLISEVKKREQLWNTKSVEYCSRFNRSKAWGEVSKVLGINERSLRIKWKSLRDTFNRELRQIKGPDHKIKWKYFPNLVFLHPGEIILTEWTEDDISVEYLEESDNVESLDMESDNVERLDMESDNVERLKTENSVSQENNYVDCNNIIKKETNASPDYDRLEDHHRWSSPGTDDDYDKMFLNSLIPYFRRIDPVRRLAVRNKIQEVLLNEISGKSET